MKITTPRLRAGVRLLRIAAPCATAAAAVLGLLAWTRGLYFLAMVNAFLCGFNFLLSWVEWTFFEL